MPANQPTTLEMPISLYFLAESVKKYFEKK